MVPCLATGRPTAPVPRRVGTPTPHANIPRGGSEGRWSGASAGPPGGTGAPLAAPGPPPPPPEVASPGASGGKKFT